MKARAALAAIDAEERDQIVSQTVKTGILASNPENLNGITITTNLSDKLYSVSVTYDASGSVLFHSALLPMPSPIITRTAKVRIN